MTQQDALDILKLGHNAYITGPAGSGKTFLIKAYITYLQSHRVGVGVTASTGIAATHLSGMTIHSWAGLGIRDDLPPLYLVSLLERSYYRRRFQRARVLIIDEVSMLHAHRLDMVDTVCKAFKNNNQPFGGLQVVLSGDFFQLPPVDRDGRGRAFAYTAPSWQALNLKVCYLDEQHRQADQEFLTVLNDIRRSRASDHTVSTLIQRYQRPITGIKVPTKLYTHNVDVDSINARELKKIQAPKHCYEMTTKGPAPLVATLQQSCLAPAQLILKEGAVVMFVKNNFDKGYVNGTFGIVTGFDEDSGYPIVRKANKRSVVATPTSWTVEENGAVKAEVTQIPLRLAWAITVHKSQGMSLDAAEIDLSKSFVPGMGYVALSRVRSLSGLKLLGLNTLALKVNPKVSQFDVQLTEQSQAAQAELRKVGARAKRQRQTGFVRRLTVAA